MVEIYEIMSSPPVSQSPQARDSSANGDEKPRLSEHEKKQNHIASGWFPYYVLHYLIIDLDSNFYLEQKRRQAIREGFDRLTELVPGLEGQGRSESVVLKKSVDYMRAQLEERRNLVARIESLGGHVDESFKRQCNKHA